jgi:hypothetical protein
MNKIKELLTEVKLRLLFILDTLKAVFGLKEETTKQTLERIINDSPGLDEMPNIQGQYLPLEYGLEFSTSSNKDDTMECDDTCPGCAENDNIDSLEELEKLMKEFKADLDKTNKKKAQKKSSKKKTSKKPTKKKVSKKSNKNK